MRGGQIAHTFPSLFPYSSFNLMSLQAPWLRTCSPGHPRRRQPGTWTWTERARGLLVIEICGRKVLKGASDARISDLSLDLVVFVGSLGFFVPLGNSLKPGNLVTVLFPLPKFYYIKYPFPMKCVKVTKILCTRTEFWVGKKCSEMAALELFQHQ